MTGFVKAGAGFGQVVAPIAAAALIAGPGWRFTCLLFGILSIPVLIGASQVLHRNPSSLGLKPDGETPDVSANQLQQEDGATLKEAFRSRTLWVLCIAKFCDLFCLFTVIVHIVPYGVDHGIEPTVAAGVLSTIGAMSIVGRIVLGGAFDRFGARWSLLTCFAVLAASLGLLQFAESAGHFFFLL